MEILVELKLVIELDLNLDNAAACFDLTSVCVVCGLNVLDKLRYWLASSVIKRNGFKKRWAMARTVLPSELFIASS